MAVRTFRGGWDDEVFEEHKQNLLDRCNILVKELFLHSMINPNSSVEPDSSLVFVLNLINILVSNSSLERDSSLVPDQKFNPSTDHSNLLALVSSQGNELMREIMLDLTPINTRVSTLATPL